MLELKTWYYDLPQELKLDRSSGPSRFPHAYTLLMVYHIAITLLCAPFLDSPPSLTGDGDARDLDQKPDEERSVEYSRKEKALQACSASVRAMLVIAQKYRKRFGSFKLSPITATYCTLSTALIVIERCCADDYTRTKSGDDQQRSFFPHTAVGLLFQVLRELSTSWNIAKRIGRNLERVYFQRYGYAHLKPPVDESGRKDAYQSPELIEPVDLTIQSFDVFNGAVEAQDMLFENSDSLQLGNLVAVHSHLSVDRTDYPGLFTHSDTLQGFSDAQDVFANNLGFACPSDCLPSDYSMFDTLNHMYLEETW